MITKDNIEAKDKSLGEILLREQFVIDEYQRSYCWKRKHIETLLEDLNYNFSNNLGDPEKANDVRLFDSYFMGPIVVSHVKNGKSIVDGQQRLTTFTLLLIYLHHLCKELEISCDINLMSYICYKRGDNVTYVLNIPKRQSVMNILVDGKVNDIFELANLQDDEDDDSTPNIINAYQQICEDFSQELRKADILPMFIEWLLDKVVLVEIAAYSNEKAYTIFETMNDRGLTLTPTEILKAHIISQIEGDEKKAEVNKLWHHKINSIIQQAGDNSDADFFKAWFRAKYAETIRSYSSNKKKEDFESIGAHFHTWFKNGKKINLHTSQEYYFFLKGDFGFFADQYIKIKQHQWWDSQDKLRGIYLTSCYPLADSLYLPLLLSPLLTQDTEDEIERKIQIVNDFVDDFNNIRTLANQSIAQTAVRNYVNNLILSIRNNTICELRARIENEKEALLQNERISLDIFAPGLYYVHYFLARLRFEEDTTELFSSLLRTKRQSSFITVPVVTYDEINQFNITNNTDLKHNVLINYCLIKRNQQDEYYSLPLSERLMWLRNKGYLREMDNEPIETMNIQSFMGIRKMKFEEFINRTWESNSKYNN